MLIPHACCLQYVGKQLPYDNINELRQRMADVAPHLAKNDSVEPPMWLNGEYFKVSAGSAELLLVLVTPWSPGSLRLVLCLIQHLPIM